MSNLDKAVKVPQPEVSPLSIVHIYTIIIYLFCIYMIFYFFLVPGLVWPQALYGRVLGTNAKCLSHVLLRRKILLR
jgi:hypothetical protein